MEGSGEVKAENEWEPFEHQVAGHLYGEGKIGMLASKKGVVLKPVQAFPKGENEVKFYESVFRSPSPSEDVLGLRRFLPQYHGIVELPDEQTQQPSCYLALENLTRNFKFPCILDVKIGKCSWDQHASQEKISREKSKCPLQHETGFRILGIKVFNTQNQTYHFYDRHICRNISNTDELRKTLISYISGTEDEHRKKAILSSIITKLEDIKEWFLKQRSFAFRSSSVLVIYEGASTSNKDCGKESDMTEYSQTEVKMIDFCHVFETNDCDSNYLQGISSLMSYLRKCL